MEEKSYRRHVSAPAAGGWNKWPHQRQHFQDFSVAARLRIFLGGKQVDISPCKWYANQVLIWLNDTAAGGASRQVSIFSAWPCPLSALRFSFVIWRRKTKQNKNRRRSEIWIFKKRTVCVSTSFSLVVCCSRLCAHVKKLKWMAHWPSTTLMDWPLFPPLVLLLLPPKKRKIVKLVSLCLSKCFHCPTNHWIIHSFFHRIFLKKNGQIVDTGS